MSAELKPSQEDRIIEDVEALFGADSKILDEIQIEYKLYRADIQKIEHAETTNDCVVAFMGKRNVGKTALLQSLFPSVDAVQALPVGDAVKTDRLTWVGAQEPLRLDATVESYLPASINQGSLTGRSLLFLDTPALGAADTRIHKLTREALLSAEIKILIVNSDDLAVEQLFTDLGEADGSIIIPVVRLSPKTTNSWADESTKERVTRDVKESVARWSRYLPRTKFMNPIFTGEFEVNHPIDDPASIALKLENELAMAMEDPDCVENSKKGRCQSAKIRLYERVRSILSEGFPRLTNSYSAVQEAEAQLPRDVIDYLFSKDDALVAFLNWQIRRSILRDIHPLLAPVRSLWTLVAYTSGAWERLLIGMQGSVLSIFMAGRKSLDNVKDSFTGDKQFRTDIHARLNGHLLNKITPSYHSFERDLRAIVGDESKSTIQSLNIEVLGLDSLTEKWVSMVDEATRLKRFRYDRLFSFVSFMLFWFLISGPLVYLYKRHIPAVLESWGATWDGSVQHQFPAFSAGDWLTTLLLSVVPVLLIGGILFSCCCRRKKVRQIVENLKKELEFSQSERECFLEVKIESAEVRAAGDLMRALSSYQTK